MAAVLSTTLEVAVRAADATLVLASITNVRKGQIVVAGAELAQVLRVGPGLTVTVLRGWGGTAASAHAAAATVDVYAANDLSALGAPPPGFAADGDVLVGQGPTTAPAFETPAAIGLTLHQVTRTLTNAQVIALPVTPITLVAAPAAGHLIVPQCVYLASHIVGQYSDIDADAYLELGVVGGAWLFPAVNEDPGTTILRDLLLSDLAVVAVGAGGTNYPLQGWGIVGQPIVLTPFLAAALILSCDNAARDEFGGGNVANTLTVSVTYLLLDATTGIFS